MYIKSALILSGVVVTTYTTFFASTTYWVSLTLQPLPRVHAHLRVPARQALQPSPCVLMSPIAAMMACTSEGASSSVCSPEPTCPWHELLLVSICTGLTPLPPLSLLIRAATIRQHTGCQLPAAVLRKSASCKVLTPTMASLCLQAARVFPADHMSFLLADKPSVVSCDCLQAALPSAASLASC